MRLSQYIKDYRIRMGLSQRDFARKCGVSHTYISFLEKEMNPTTGEKLVPSMEKLYLLSKGMGITIDKLLQEVDDMPLVMSEPGEQYEYERISESKAERIRPKLSIPSMRFQANTSVIDATIGRFDRTSREDDLLALFRTMTKSDQDKLLDYARYTVDSYKRPDKRK